MPSPLPGGALATGAESSVVALLMPGALVETGGYVAGAGYVEDVVGGYDVDGAGGYEDVGYVEELVGG